MPARSALVVAVLAVLATAAPADGASFTFLPISPLGQPYCDGFSTDALLISPDGSLVWGREYRFNGALGCVWDGVVWSAASGWTRSPSVGGSSTSPFLSSVSAWRGFSETNALLLSHAIDCASCEASEDDPYCANPGDSVTPSVAPGAVTPVISLPDLTCSQDLCPFDVSVDARAISRDGTTVVGGSVCGAFRWTAATGAVAISPPGDTGAVATSVSDDGGVVVGHTSTNALFAWSSAGGFQTLPVTAPGGPPPYTIEVCGDGSTIIGTTTTPQTQAFVWTAADGVVLLGDLPGGSFQSIAVDVSADGTMVAGTSRSSLGNEAFAWTRGGGMIGFGAASETIDMTPAGLVLVSPTMLWDPATGWQRSIESLLADGGVTAPDQIYADGLSDDGRTVIGHRIFQISEPWVATLPPVGYACSNSVDDDGDGFTDYAIDADLDGISDAPGDPVCRTPSSPSESAKCQDGVNNDGQPGTDWDAGASQGVDDPNGADPECVGKPWRDTEAGASCGLGSELSFVMPLLALLARSSRRSPRA